MPFAGLDLHKKEIEAAILDDHGELLHRERFPCTRQGIETFAKGHLSRGHEVVVEATFNTWTVVDILQPFVKKAVVSNPHRNRAIAAAKIKTDKIDAFVLAWLLYTGFLCEVWNPDEQTRQLRQQCSARANLTADRTRIKNRIHAVLNHRLIQTPVAELFSPAGRCQQDDASALDLARR